MGNDPKANLIYAIMALDSYNRDYGSGISKLSSILGKSQLGSWTIYDKRDDAQAQNAGFYAIAYQSGDQKVIAYRGTDSNTDRTSQGASGSDLANGYGLALGLTPDSTVNFATDQSKLAAAFYTAVTQKREGEAASNVTVVGHSLGSGLAGYVGAVAGTKAVVFDNMDASTNTLPIATSAGDLAKLTPGKLGLTFKKTDPRQPQRLGVGSGPTGGRHIAANDDRIEVAA